MGNIRWARLAVIGIGTLLGPLDSAVNIAFPDITQSFAIALPSIRWVIIAYVATYASLVLVFGRLGDLFGHVRVFNLGLVVSALGFLFCSLAPAFGWLLACRVLQGVGAAMVLSCGPALATNLFHESVRPRVLGTYAMLFGLGGAIGPMLGGALVDVFGWPAVFWFRLPIAVVALALAIALRLPAPPRADGQFDFLGSILLVAAISLVLVAFGQLQDLASNPLLAATISVAAVCTALASFQRARTRQTSAPAFGRFRNYGFVLINFTNIVVNLVGFAVMLFVPYFLVRTTTLPLPLAGIVLAAGPMAMIGAAQLGGFIAHRFGANRLALLGATMVTCATALIGAWGFATAPSLMIAVLLLHGAGLGLFQVSCLELVTSALPQGDRGVAGSLVMLMRTVGVVLAASILTAVFAHIQADAALKGEGDGFLAGFQSTFRFAAYALCGFLLLTLLRPGVWLKKWPSREPN